MSPARRETRGASVLEVGLAAILIAAPLPFGAVQDPGRAALEWGAIALLAVALAVALADRRSGDRPALPPRFAGACIAGLVLLAVVQTLPLGSSVVRALSPGAAEIREEVRPPAAVEAVETEVLGASPTSFERTATLSLVPGATRSAVRAGAALAAVWMVAFAVGAAGGTRRVAAAIVASAAFQAFYGALVLFSGHDRIWNVPKKYFLDAATGTFVNRNHFAHVVALGTIVGVGWVVASGRSRAERADRGRSWVRWFERDGLQHAGRVALVVTSAAGLLLSFSRAGLALGTIGAGVAAVRTSPGRRAPRVLVTIALAVVALVPLARFGPERLVARYAALHEDASDARGRAGVWADTARMAMRFPVAGTGFGTFEWTYPRFRSQAVRQRFVHAHNDPLQVAAEGGALGVLLLVGALAAHAGAWRRSWTGANDPLAVALAVALVAGLAHACVDFPFHVPGAAVFPAAIAGLMLGRSCRARA